MENKWKQFNLLEVASISEKRVSDFEGERNYVATRDIDLNRIVSAERVTYKNRASRADLLMTQNDVLFAKMKGTIKVLVGSKAVEDKIFSTGFYILSPEKNISKDFLYFFFLTDFFNKQKDSLCTGATMSGLNNSGLKRIKVPIPVDKNGNPDLTEQKRIVAILEEAEALKNKRAEADQKMDAVILTLFNKMFGNPEDSLFPTKQLIEIVDPQRPITYGILKPGPNIEDGVPYVRVLDIKQNHLHVDQLRRTTTKIADQYKRSNLNQGDILVTIRGTVGRTCMVPKALQGANITQDTARLSILPNIIAEYVVWYLNTAWAQRWMSRHTIGQAVQGINIGDLKELPVLMPPTPLQRQFVDKAREIKIQKDKQKQSAEKINDIFQSLLSHTFSGNI